MAEILLQEKTEEGILILTLNRSEAMNCFNIDLLKIGRASCRVTV